MARIDAKALRSALYDVATEKRRAFAAEMWNGGIPSYCKPCKARDRACVYPSHWRNADAMEAAEAFGIAAELYSPNPDGSVTATVTPDAEPAPVTPDMILSEPDQTGETPSLVATTSAGAVEKLSQALAEMLASQRETVDAEQVAAIVDTKLAEALANVPTIAPVRVEITHSGEPVRVVDKAHRALPAAINRAKARDPQLWVGPTGCGKTHMARQLAEALGLPFYMTSCSAGMSEGQLGGRLLPTGERGRFEWTAVPFTMAYETGGVMLLDEMDAADPNALTFINAAIANGHMALPNRVENPMATRHPDFVLVAAANTYGTGASREYVGRNQLDAATLNRFQIGTIEMDYDEGLEAAIVAPEWLSWGHRVRSAIREHKLRRVLSTRDMLCAQRLEAAGEPRDGVLRSYFAGWRSDELERVPSECKAADHA